MHRDAAVARDDADVLNGLAPAFGMEAFDGERRGGVDVNPVILSVHAQRGLVDVHRRLCEEALDGLVFPLGERVMELGDVAEERRLGQELADEGVHRLGDALEREHLRDEQVHDVGLDAGAVLERSGHLGGEARPGLGVAARAVLDFGVGVTHDLLEHDVDEGAALVSEATLLGYVAQLHRSLAEWERHAIERLLASPAMHVDETSLRVDRKNHWIHVYSAGTLTVKRLHPKRGCEAIEAIGILPRYGGVAVHDCWASYLSYTHCEHALCGAHLLRELTFIVDAHDYAWAKRMKRLLLHACHEVAKRDEKILSESEYKAVQKRYRTILTQGERELPPIPPRQKGQRGKVAKSDAHNLWERMKKYENAVLRFAKHPDVAFTNNRAERDLRMSKVKQKVSGCFRTRKYAEAYCRISSYLQSMANQGYNPLVAIQIALAGRAVDNLPE